MDRLPNNDLFPTESDLSALVADARKGHLKGMLATEGVFLYARDRFLPSRMGRFAFDQSWYGRAYGNLSGPPNSRSVTGCQGEGDVAEFLEVVSELADTELLTPTPVRFSMRPAGPTGAVLHVTHTEVKGRRARRIQRIEHEFDVEVVAEGSQIRILAFPRSSKDSTIAKALFRELLKRGALKEEVVDLDRVSTRARVRLFNRLLESKEADEWNAREVCGLSIRMGETAGHEDVEVSAEDLKVLKAAHLEGRNLDRHDLVEQLIDDGYYFSAASYWAACIRDSRFSGELKIDVGFKLRPKVLLIQVSAARQDTDDGRLESCAVPHDVAADAMRSTWSAVVRHFRAVQ